jgi:hypothetical protein
LGEIHPVVCFVVEHPIAVACPIIYLTKNMHFLVWCVASENCTYCTCLSLVPSWWRLAGGIVVSFVGDDVLNNDLSHHGVVFVCENMLIVKGKHIS